MRRKTHLLFVALLALGLSANSGFGKPGLSFPIYDAEGSFWGNAHVGTIQAGPEAQSGAQWLQFESTSLKLTSAPLAQHEQFQTMMIAWYEGAEKLLYAPYRNSVITKLSVGGNLLILSRGEKLYSPTVHQSPQQHADDKRHTDHFPLLF